jgi:hypothetical protein
MTVVANATTSLAAVRCHCGKRGGFGYRDRAAWPRRSATGSAAEPPPETRLLRFCAEHRFGQHYADVSTDAAHAFDGSER